MCIQLAARLGIIKPGLVKSCNDMPRILDYSVFVVDSATEARTTKKTPWKISKWQQTNWEKLKNNAGVLCEGI